MSKKSAPKPGRLCTDARRPVRLARDALNKQTSKRVGTHLGTSVGSSGESPMNMQVFGGGGDEVWLDVRRRGMRRGKAKA